AHYLQRFGEAALPPLVPFSEALKIREEAYKLGQVWPFEHVVPGVPKAPNATAYLERKKQKEEKRTKRAKEINDALAKMPQLIADYKAARKIDWAEVSIIDKLTLSKKQIREKYVKRRLMKQN
uniref:mL64 n=1 Tax=Polytomella magna TaxID=353565 RepID=UPI002240E4CC|nr:Chain AJ, mL64 [Polytomella magna]8APN_AJ Chain AJ, mL64 [Polytomella magna]8APO_AJ Chain AJ, mL64 [Polytomella magna]